jgi:hypothetical protein
MNNTSNHINNALGVIAMLALGTTLHAQGTPGSAIPAPVQAAFTKEYPAAFDVEWKAKGTQYKVEFETGLFFVDHEIWYDGSGKVIRHEEEIATSDLPAAVATAASAEFPGYRIDDVERITADGTTSYMLEMKLKGQSEWKVAYDANGKQLQKRVD